jgi:hypothetical protein
VKYISLYDNIIKLVVSCQVLSLKLLFFSESVTHMQKLTLNNREQKRLSVLDWNLIERFDMLSEHFFLEFVIGKATNLG